MKRNYMGVWDFLIEGVPVAESLVYNETMQSEMSEAAWIQPVELAVHTQV
jgi:hypothetical protein